MPVSSFIQQIKFSVKAFLLCYYKLVKSLKLCLTTPYFERQAPRSLLDHIKYTMPLKLRFPWRVLISIFLHQKSN